MSASTKKRGIQYCSQYEDFPSSVVNEFNSDGVSNHKNAVENLKRMKEVEIEAWIAEKERKVHLEFYS